MSCLDENLIDRLVEGRLIEAERASVEQHLAGCSACRVLVSELVREPRKEATGGGAAHGGHTLTFVGGASASADERLFAIGECLADRYRVVRFLAEGGMGEVYEAEDLELRRRVALKTVRPEIASDPRVIDRFRREISLAHKVSHPNVCRIFDLGFHPRKERVTFLTMEFLDGETLSERVRRGGRFSPAEALPIIEQMANGLAAAHAVGVVHRDFKSQNVMLVGAESQRRAVVSDFGLAGSSAAEDAAAGSTSTSGLVGSPAYMAPEQVEGRKVDERADVYALGVVMYEMMTGTWPFVADTPMLTAIKRLQEDAPSPRIHNPALDARWEETILRCLRRDPQDRYVSVLDVARALAAPAVIAPVLTAPPLIGRTVGNFMIKERLSADEVSTSYSATHAQIERRIVVRVFHAGVSRKLIDAFIAEAKAATALHSAHIAEILDFGEIDGRMYFTSMWLNGSRLSEVLETGPLSIARSLRVVREIGQALGAAHERGIVHGLLDADRVHLEQVKPGSAHVKVLDFGLAKVLRAGEELGTHTDTRALCVLAYRALTGVAPDEDQPTPLRALRAEIPRGVEQAVLRGLGRDLAYRNVRAFLEALEADEPTSLVPALPARSRNAWVLVSVAVVAAVVATVFIMRPSSQPLAPAPVVRLVAPPIAPIAPVTPVVVEAPAAPIVAPRANVPVKSERPKPPRAKKHAAEPNQLITDYPE